MMRQLGVLGLIVVLGGTVQAQDVFRHAGIKGLPGAASDYVAAIIVADVGRPGGGLPDGKLDVLTLNRNQQVPTLFGQGNGTFATGPNTDVGLVPAGFAVGHFTSADFLDLLVTDDSQGTLVFQRGSTAGPPWAPPGPAVSAGAAPVAIVPTDVDKNGKLDAVVVDAGASGQGAIVVLLGNGDGTFTPGAIVGAGLDSVAGAVGNFDNDLFPDVAVVNAGDDTVTIFRNNGTGGFTVAQTEAVGAGPTSIAVGKLNADDRPDIVVANEAGDSVSVLIGRGGALFEDAHTYTSGSEGSAPRSVALADVNGDGHLDVLTANAMSLDVSVLLGDSQGHLARPRSFVSDLQPEAVGTGDFDGDGLDDAAAVNQGTDDGPSVTALLSRPDSNGALAAVENVMTLPNPVAVAMGDADDNGVADLIVGSGAVGANGLEVFLATLAGGFAAPVAMTPPSGVVAVGRGDFNGDGTLDIAVANKQVESVSAFLNRGRAQFGPAVSTDIGGGAAAMAVGDWNRDGRSDLAVARQINGPTGPVAGAVDILLANVDGTFSAASPLTAEESPLGIDSGDFNNDGRLDLVVANQASRSLSVWLGAGTGTFAAPTTVAVAGGSGPRAVAVGDFDHDGFDDVATVTEAPGSRLRLYYNDRHGGFTPGQELALASQGIGVALTARDLTGDLLPDVLVADESSNNRAVVFICPGNRTARLQIQGFGVSRGPMATASGDVDGDGRYDGAVANSLVSNASVLTNIRATPVRRGDGNNDGRVTAADIVAVFRELPENPTGRVEVIDRESYEPGAGIDANGDGLVTAQDTSGTIAWAFRPF